MNRSCLALLVVSLAALAACAPKQAAGPADVAVATVNGKPMSANTFNQYVKGVAGKPAEDLKPEERTELIDNLVRGYVIAQEAERSGLASRDEVRALLELSRLSILQQASSQDYLKDRKPSEEELRAEYGLQVAQLDKLQYRISHIQVPTEEQAKKVLTDLAKGANFAAMAKAQSVDGNTRERGGDLDWASQGSMPPAFAAAVATLKKGETAPAPVKTDFGWHVVRVTDTRENPPPTFEAVRERLVQIVESKKFKAWVDGLIAKATIEKTP